MIVLTKWTHCREAGMDKIDLFKKYKPCTVIDTIFTKYEHYKHDGMEGITVIEAFPPKFRDFRHVPFDTMDDAIKGLQLIKNEVDESKDEVIFIRNIDDFPRAFPVKIESFSEMMDDDYRDNIKKYVDAISKFVNSFPDKKIVLMSNVLENFGQRGFIAGDYQISKFETWKKLKFDAVIEMWNANWWKNGARLW